MHPKSLSVGCNVLVDRWSLLGLFNFFELTEGEEVVILQHLLVRLVLVISWFGRVDPGVNLGVPLVHLFLAYDVLTFFKIKALGHFRNESCAILSGSEFSISSKK